MISRILASTFLAFLAFAALIPAARADALEDANKAYYKREYETAFDLFKPLAEQGNAEAEYRVGWMYMYGLGIYRSYPDAIDWLTKAANQGVPEATHQVAQMYDLGLGVEKNNVISYMWYAICKRQITDLERKPTTFNPSVDMSIMREVMSKEEVDEATKLAATWKRLGPDGKPSPLPPKQPKNNDQFPLPGKTQY